MGIIETNTVENRFSGKISAEYSVHRLLNPHAEKMREDLASLVGSGSFAAEGGATHVWEIGCGTGWTTEKILRSRNDVKVTAVDLEPQMIDETTVALKEWISQGRAFVVESDALSFARQAAAESFHLVVSVYVLHNLFDSVRAELYGEIFRILKPGGIFVNADRYALDDPVEHSTLMSQQVRRYVRRLLEAKKEHLIEEWAAHIMSDECPTRVMRESSALEAKRVAGFEQVGVRYRNGVDAFVVATKGI